MIHNPIPTQRAYLVWQAKNMDGNRTHYPVAELRQDGGDTQFEYLNGRDMEAARKVGFTYYPGLPMDPPPNPTQGLEVLSHRLMSPARPDYVEWLEDFGLCRNNDLSDLSLLAYTGARSLRDTFSVCETFYGFEGEFSYLFEVAGYRHYRDVDAEPKKNQPMRFVRDDANEHDKQAVRIETLDDQPRLMGYVNKLQASAVRQWLDRGAIEAKVFRNYTHPYLPRLWVYADILSDAGVQAA